MTRARGLVLRLSLWLAALASPSALAEDPPPAPQEGEDDAAVDEWGQPLEGELAAGEEPVLGDVPADDFAAAADAPTAEHGTTIVGDRRARRRVAGSAHIIDQEALERLEYDDVHQILRRVPGVYLRDEDGFGLRPNIGLRGASSDRSSKITLLEDGVPLSPAPYSAPAAYYFPLATRVIGVEVFKGPASIRHGPQTIGGAINLRTRRIPWGADGGIDLAVGAYESGKAHAFVGYGDENVGILLEGLQLSSGGFKQLDGGGPTGFRRNDVMLKARLSTAPLRAVQHALELKLGYGDEDSHETYLGLSEEDFRQRPYRRYRGSQLDHMQWHRTQAQLRYRFAWDALDVQVVAYRHDFHRAWQKLNRFRAGPSLNSVLAYPDAGRSAIYYQVLSGAADSNGPEQALMLGTNDRTFVSQGIEARGHLALRTWILEHVLEVGARLHEDHIDRLHTEDSFLMQSGRLVPDGRQTVVNVDSRASAIAGALYVTDEVRFGAFLGELIVAPGLRLELIRTQLDDHKAAEANAGGLVDTSANSAWQLAWLPGIGASWQPLPFLGLLAGVHKGFSPVSPGQPQEVQAEEAWSYESGVRLFSGENEAELIGFASHYSNITGECTMSSGCSDAELYRQFNGGAALVYGLEAMARQSAHVFGVTLNADLVYTLTLSRFLSSFVSSSPLFGSVEEGDELPYVPLHQGSLLLGAQWRGLDVALVGTVVGAMRDVPGQGALEVGEGTDPALLLDASASYRLFSAGQLYLRADNLLGSEHVAARRPFGARPGKPRSFFVGYKHDFF